PPTPGFERADRELEELDILARPRPVRGGAFLSLSLGLGGQASVTLVGAP
ncbi:MAG: beta-ketoacyl-ACP synthase, partial [Candidatus Tectomicrobia bacterium]|nr:beta-ketoacyl-ACP synthase [Candidatus Tectomicrobia bacterium]